jgi:Uma2 family endonuclease
MLADPRAVHLGDNTEVVLATGVSFEDYLERFSGLHSELVEGKVIQMSPASREHNNLNDYLGTLVSAYFELRPIGEIISQPFTIKLPNVEAKREPDLLIVLESNPHPVYSTYMDGPPDICIEIVSPDSVIRDREAKLLEYQTGGVKEYWLFDRENQDSIFYRLNADGRYVAHYAEADGSYRTPLLPGFALEIETLWRSPLPGPGAIVEAVRLMLGVGEA